jgi:hypothetical protein
MLWQDVLSEALRVGGGPEDKNFVSMLLFTEHGGPWLRAARWFHTRKRRERRRHSHGLRPVLALALLSLPLLGGCVAPEMTAKANVSATETMAHGPPAVVASLSVEARWPAH